MNVCQIPFYYTIYYKIVYSKYAQLVHVLIHGSVSCCVVSVAVLLSVATRVFINPFQFAFIKGRSIVDNVLVMHDMVK